MYEQFIKLLTNLSGGNIYLMKSAKLNLSQKKIQIIFKLIFIFSFLSYIETLIEVTLFKYISITDLFSSERWFYIQFINYVPFSDWNIDRGGLIRDVLLNIALFFPFGFLLQMINKNNKINLLQIFIPFTTSISIEILQYIFSVGVTDITDVICNTLGAILGAISYLVFNIIFKKNNIKANKILLCFIGLFAIVNLCLSI